MGAPASDPWALSFYGPEHKVTIRQPFAVGKFEVTFAQWDACVDAGGCNQRPDDHGWGRGRRPVIYVSWNDAKEYVAWLSRKTEKSYRLVSEAEWEYGARAGTITRYAFGGVINRSQAQFSEGARGTAGSTAVVGSFPANRFGLHDMHGNVSEWVEDNWHNSGYKGYEGAPTDGSAWLDGDASMRMLRGGSWMEGPGFITSFTRIGGAQPGGRGSNLVGFRIARTL